MTSTHGQLNMTVIVNTSDYVATAAGQLSGLYPDGVVDRYFNTLDPALTGYYDIATAWAPGGDFNITLDFATSESTVAQSIIGGTVDTTDSINIDMTLAGIVRAFIYVDGVISTIISSVSAYNDGKFHTVELSLTTTTFSLTVDTETPVTTSVTAGADEDVLYIGRRAAGSYFDGVIANVKLEDLSQPGNTFTFELNEGVSGTEVAMETGNSVTYNNITDRELLILTGADWVSAEIATNGDFATNSDWTLGTNMVITGGQVIGTGLDTSTKSRLRQEGILTTGKSYNLIFAGTSDSGDFQPENSLGSSYSSDALESSVSYVDMIYITDQDNLRFKRFSTINNLALDSVSIKRILEAP